MSRHLGSVEVSAVALCALVAVLAQGVPTAPAMEQISFVYERIVWTYSKQKIEADFRRIAAEKRLKASPAEIAGAAHAAFAAGVTHHDNWEENQMVIRGCGPQQELCFVITCNRCSAGE